MKNLIIPGLLTFGLIYLFRQKSGAEEIRASITSVRIDKFDPSGISLNLNVRIQNLSKFLVRVNSIAGEILSGGSSQATFQSASVGSIPANETKQISINAFVPSVAAVRALLKFAGNPTGYVNSLTIRMLINTPQAQITVNTDVRGNAIDKTGIAA
ncbi:MAG: hypothetical protein VKL39_21715 [Leptolyngbyaceae bacterium]|nr:hypothetical protein [Leptolyngbyaceae bacterium]